MKKFPLIFLLCVSFLSVFLTAFIYKTEIFFSKSAINATWQSLTNLPYTLSHNVTVGSDSVSNSILIMGGIASDSITSRILLYNASTALYDTTLPKLPRRLMNGFGFKIKDSIYYGGGYTTNWKDTSLSSADTLYDCVYPTTTTGYISGQRGKVYFTSNSGGTWITRLLPDTTKNAVGISFASDSVGFAVMNMTDSNTAVYSTSNKGISWSAKLSGAKLNDIFFQGTSTGWVCGDNGSIKKTTNSGTTWTSTTIGSDNYKSIYFIANSGTGFISGTNGKIIKTTNSGANWISQSTGTTKNLNSVVFSDSLIGYAVGDSGIIIKTTNGGTTWATQSSNTILNLRSVEKINASKIIASGDRGIIIYTTNGGAEWVQRVGVSSNRLNRVCIPPSDSIATAIGVKGWVVKANKPFFEYLIMDTFYKINVKNLSAGWQNKAALPLSIAEVFSSACSVNDRYAYVIGGRTSGFNYSDSVMIYNHFSNVWSFRKKLPAKISESGVAVIGRDKIMVVGGKRSDSISSRVYIGTVDSMNASSFGSISWAAGSTDFPVPTYAMGSIGFSNKKIAFFMGGNTSKFSFLDGPSGPSSKIYMYKAETGVFTEIQTDAANPICHTGVDGFLGTIPSTSSGGDTSVSLFAPGGRDSNYVAVNRHKVLKINGLVSVQQLSSEIPFRFKLEQNYPNPFNPVTKIKYELPKQSFVQFKIFDLLGKEVAVYINKMQSEGVYEVTFDGKSLASGIYFYQLKTDSFTETRKMLLIK